MVFFVHTLPNAKIDMPVYCQGLTRQHNSGRGTMGGANQGDSTEGEEVCISSYHVNEKKYSGFFFLNHLINRTS